MRCLPAHAADEAARKSDRSDDRKGAERGGRLRPRGIAAGVITKADEGRRGTEEKKRVSTVRRREYGHSGKDSPEDRHEINEIEHRVHPRERYVGVRRFYFERMALIESIR